MLFEGIFTPLVTPFQEDFTCNQDALEALVEDLIAAGVHGLVVGALAGEHYAQTMKERVWLMSRVRKMIAGRVPLIAGTGAIRTEDSVEYAVRAVDAGADALLVSAPQFACPSAREIAAHVKAVDEAANLPVMLLDDPARLSVTLDADCFDLLAQSPNIGAVAGGSLTAISPDLARVCGRDDDALDDLTSGARAWLSAGSNIAPRACVALYQACIGQGDLGKARAIMSALHPLMRLLEQGGTPVQVLKYGLTKRGIAAGPPRKPLLPLTATQKRHVDAVLDQVTAALGDLPDALTL